MTALEYKTNVICEKPLAITYNDAVEMFDFAKKQGVTLTACQTLRFMPERQAAYKLIKECKVGKIYSCEFSRVSSRGIPNWGKFHIKKFNDGGSFLDMGSHSIDSALWLIGNPKPVSVTAAMYTVHADEIVDPKRAGAFAGTVSNKYFRPEDMDVEFFASGSVTFENSIIMLFKATWAANLEDENPEASTHGDITLENNKFLVLVKFNLVEYLENTSDKAVKKTLTIPSWLNKLAERNNVNFSRVLQSALKEMLNLNY